MKKITSITLENYRAFYGKYDPVLLENGENVLIYGENGSGKSSLFKGLRDFLEASNDPTFSFIRNHHDPQTRGSLQVTFTDFDDQTKDKILGTDTNHSLNDPGFTNNQPFIQNADLVKGFLDYRRLLEVYLHKEERPNLFEFIVLNLLYKYPIPAARYRIGEKWKQIDHDLFNVYNRNERIHGNAITDLAEFESNLRLTLNRISRQVNAYLLRFFKQNMRVNYTLAPMRFDYGRGKWQWNVIKDLRLDITLDGVALTNYSDILNEARMSALAICLYLAAQRNIPQNIQYKVLFLDDIFIGLDSGNRIPVTKILQHSFPDYQMFITTYDRHWFELAKNLFKNSGQSWKFLEFYAKKEKPVNVTFTRPLIIEKDSAYDKAVQYLHHDSNPDYPASANYFRKHLEEILSKQLPEHEIRNEDQSKIEAYRLKDLLKSAEKFLSKINDSVGLVMLASLNPYLHSLLHPLSHNNLSSPIYKAELIDLQRVLPSLESHLISLSHQYRLFISVNEKYDLTFQVNPSHTGHFKLRAEENHYLYKDTNGAIQVSSGKCRCVVSYDTINGVKTQVRTHTANDVNFNYNSFLGSYNTIHAYLIAQPATAHLIAVVNPLTELAYTPRGGNQTTIEDYKNSLAW
ncbi:recombinational DNA repair ATPase RecF [Roseivirga ehrenbergii]|uniref:RecF/RecN/SMC N-terminal domain-containing protein n=1 Tax=Roseivirga ehrenbergii (strain DSM 102268 / JCM 13514 / KCTC 12282 / NCIMB 14502 / KMM 6017) TaxID=279360 RepID=A0A150XRJ2_ROSEK|nr:ATP-binding protein [Roseivirga ehrenbergii]KYG81369.1 hypothetical protein MB14_12280 [Roseivirga ehrenbergii]TCL10511.1 recombinational DNA repair ATPase RecF [Roseivirga ehrenbergii]